MFAQVAVLRAALLIGLLQGFISVVQSQCDGECVPIAQCNDYDTNIIDVRGKRSSRFGTNDDFEEPKVFGSCGMRNRDGVGFRIVGTANNEAQFGEFPWMAAIMKVEDVPGEDKHEYVCGGSLIGPKIVLTAAHCVADRANGRLVVRVGEWDTMTTDEVRPYQEQPVNRIVTHPRFNKEFLLNDIALLILEDSFQPYENVQLACLPQQGTVFDNASECFTSGWGKENFNSQRYPTILKKAELPMVPNAECQTALRGTRLSASFLLHDSFVCAGGQHGIDACTGDGGSPLVCPAPDQFDKYFLTGIVAWGIGCGQEGIPGVYVKVSMYTDWIVQRMTEIDNEDFGFDGFNLDFK